MHIHVMEGMEEEDLRTFFGLTVGSKYSITLEAENYIKKLDTDDPSKWTTEQSEKVTTLIEKGQKQYPEVMSKYDSAFAKVSNTPNTRIGEVNWVTAAATKNFKAFVPTAIAMISELIGEELPILDNELERRIVEALKKENITHYSLTPERALASFLASHKGKKLFIVNW